MSGPEYPPLQDFVTQTRALPWLPPPSKRERIIECLAMVYVFSTEDYDNALLNIMGRGNFVGESQRHARSVHARLAERGARLVSMGPEEFRQARRRIEERFRADLRGAFVCHDLRNLQKEKEHLEEMFRKEYHHNYDTQ